MPRSDAVTTAQIVRTMKRGENGSISVSMGPSGEFSRPFLAASLAQLPEQPVHDIGGRGHRYDNRRPRGYRIARRRINPSGGQVHHLVTRLSQCNVTARSRNTRPSW